MIPLTQGQYAVVDEEDWVVLAKHKWFAWLNNSTKMFYAARNKSRFEKKNKGTREYMHRRVLGLNFGDLRQGDHINHDTLDNRSENLRIVTPRQNQENRRDNSKAGIGIRRRKSGPGKKYEVYIAIKDKDFYLGSYVSVEEAKRVRENFKQENNLA